MILTVLTISTMSTMSPGSTILTVSTIQIRSTVNNVKNVKNFSIFSDFFVQLHAKLRLANYPVEFLNFEDFYEVCLQVGSHFFLTMSPQLLFW